MHVASLEKIQARLAVVLGMALAFGAGSALAAEAPLDEANALVTKATTLLKGSDAAGESEQASAHRKKAIELLTRAQSEILKAKQ